MSKRVAPGTILGTMGETGDSQGGHLHLDVSKNGQYVNPLHYFPTIPKTI